MSDDTPELSRVIRIDELPPKGMTCRLEPSPGELDAVAARLGIVKLSSLDADLKVQPEMGRQVTLSGPIRAEIVQNCIVTGDPLTTRLEFELDRTFAEDADPFAGLVDENDESITDPEIEEPDPIIDGKIDVGEHAVEELALNIPPYPRSEGATFEDIHDDAPGDDGGESPFAALEELKNRMNSKD